MNIQAKAIKTVHISYIRLLIITMTERIMHSEKTCRIYQTNKKNEQLSTDTSNEYQYTFLQVH